MILPPLNFARVDGRVWRGGAPDAEGWAWLAARGVHSALNLEWERADDLSLVAGVAPYRVADFEPLPWIAPSLADAHVKEALALIRHATPVVYVHCRSGQNRTGVVVAAYRLLVLGQDMEHVVADFKFFRGWWAWADERYIRGLPARRAELLGER